MSILDEIYNEIYLGEEPDTEEYRELRESYYAVWDKVEEILSEELFDKVWNAVVELNTVESRNHFKEGFRLGVQLMSEARTLPGESEAVR